MAISYARFKAIFGDLGITEWVKYNWLSNAGTARTISNKVVEAGYNPLAYVNDELYNHITKTINIWDEEWEVRYTNFVFNKTHINVEPNTEYFLYSETINTFSVYFRDKDSVLIGEAITRAKNTTFTTPNNCYYVDFSYQGTTYNHNICINVSNPYINGNYFPYFEGEKFLVLVGEVDLGSFIWSKQSNKFYIQSQISDMKAVSGWKAIPNFFCSKYQVVGQVNIVDTMTDKSITMIYNSQKSIQIYDSELYSSMTTAQFKQAMSGIPIYYQLATPVLVDL